MAQMFQSIISSLPGWYVMLSFDPTFGFALSLKSVLTSNILLSPPPMKSDGKIHIINGQLHDDAIFIPGL